MLDSKERCHRLKLREASLACLNTSVNLSSGKGEGISNIICCTGTDKVGNGSSFAMRPPCVDGKKLSIEIPTFDPEIGFRRKLNEIIFKIIAVVLCT